MAIATAALCLTPHAIASAQEGSQRDTLSAARLFAEARAGSRLEDELRLRQLLSANARTFFSMRPLTRRQLAMLSAPDSSTKGYWHFSVLVPRPEFAAEVNTLRPYSDNDGPRWAGRGLTVSGTAGVVVFFGPLSISVRPEAFISQNKPFAPATSGADDFKNEFDPKFIDAPRRFGDHQYGLISPGESWVRLDTRVLSVSVTTAAQTWGPARVFPLIMGTNAGGFPQMLIESGAPWNVGVGRLRFRSVVGKLAQSGYAPIPGVGKDSTDYRVGAGVTAVFVPVGLRQLELGAGRFFHRYRSGAVVSLATMRIPFEDFYKRFLQSQPGYNQSADNQLASFFARIAVQGVEAYGEYARDDHSVDPRDLAAEPDHASAWVMGFRRVFGSSGQVRSIFAFEVLNSRETHLKRVRDQAPFYTHTGLTEGHTYRGQVIGSPAAQGGGGMEASYERRNSSGGWVLALRTQRIGQNWEGGTWYGKAMGFTGLTLERRMVSPKAEVALTLRTQSYWAGQGTNISLGAVVTPGLGRLGR